MFSLDALKGLAVDMTPSPFQNPCTAALEAAPQHQCNISAQVERIRDHRRSRRRLPTLRGSTQQG